MDTTSRSRGVITLAYGHARFAEQARSLALSLKLHAPHLRRALVTDSTDPEVLSLFTEVIPLRRDWGAGVRQKFFLDRYSPYDETLFIDSDCLALGNLDAFWTAFAGSTLVSLVFDTCTEAIGMVFRFSMWTFCSTTLAFPP
jgi:hypothetical protein